MNAFQILEQIMEAIADGRKPSETVAQFRDRKADELQQHFDDKARVAKQEERVAHKQAIKAKKEYEQNPSSETGQNMANTAIKALDKSMATTSAERKADKIKRIKGKIDWRKSMSEAFEIMEEIMNAIDKRYPKGSERNKELKRSATTAKMDAEEVAKEHALGKRPEPAPMKGGWDIRTWEIPAETPEEREYSKKETDYDIKQIRKEFTKNKTGEHETKKKQFPKSYKDVGVLGEPDAKELETERTARKALGKRKAKMNKNEALEIMEEIINVVESSKEELVNKYVPNMKAERRHLDKEVKKGKKLTKGLEKSADVSADMAKIAKKEADQADDNYFNIRTNPNITSDERNKAYKELKAARTEMGDWKRDEQKTRKEAKETKAKAEEANKKRNELNKKIANLKGHSDVATDKAFEALEILESILSYADNLFELDYEEKQNISPNKITKVKKDKNGEKVEVVSVADELFPYSGNAKEQFNQKVLAKINDMIEGTGSLEDLIQFVRKGVATKKAVHEGKEPNKECEYRKAKWEEATQKYFDTKKKNMDFEGQHPETKKAYDEERKAYANLDKARRDSKKINGPYEAFEKAIDLIETFIKEARDPITRSAVGMTLRGKEAEYNKHVDDIAKYTERANSAKGYRAQVNQEKADDAERKAEEANKDLRKTKGEYLEGLRQRGLTNPQAHAVLKKAVGEAFDLMEEIINEISDRVYRIGKNKVADIGNAQEEAAKTAEGEDKEWTKDQVAKRSHQAAVLDDKYERQVAKRAEEEYKKSKVDKSSKK